MIDRVRIMRQRLADRLRLAGCYRRVFETEDGKVVLRHLMRVGFVTKSTFVANDPHETALNEGQRRLVLSVLRFACKDLEEIQQQIEKGITDENP